MPTNPIPSPQSPALKKKKMSEKIGSLPLLSQNAPEILKPANYHVRILNSDISPEELARIKTEITKIYYLCSIPHDSDPKTGEMIDPLSPTSATEYPWAVSKGWLFGTDDPKKIDSYVNQSLSPDTAQNCYYRMMIIQDNNGEVVGWSRLKMVRDNLDIRSGKVWQTLPGRASRSIETPKGRKKLFQLRHQDGETFITIYGPRGEKIVKDIRAIDGPKNHRPSGYLWFSKQDQDSYRGPFIEVDEIAIDPAFRSVKNQSGQTPAELLLIDVESLAKKSKFNHVFAWVCTGPYFPNFASWSFFKKRDFTEVALVESLSEEDVTVAVALRKSL